MSVVKTVFFKEKNKCPVLEWMEEIPPQAQMKGEARLKRLGQLGHEMRRPEVDYLRDGIYELRWRFQSVNYRLLYFFFGREIVVVSHGLTKEDKIPPQEIDLAIRRKEQFVSNPQVYSLEEE